LTASARPIEDSVEQCVHHGEAGWAVRAGIRSVAELKELGSILGSPVDLAADERVVADL
jgi:ornithine cyclodeaminase